MYPILGVSIATGVIAVAYLLSGGFPNPISIANIYLVGLGLGLVVARLWKLGPFEGALGSPWFESEVQETLSREALRAQRYGRELAVAVVRPADRTALDLRRLVRATDQIIECRDGWSILILPETSPEGAMLLLRQIGASRRILASVTAPERGRTNQHLETSLLELIGSVRDPNIIRIDDHQPANSLSLAS